MPVRLNKCEINFHTGDDDKDYNTRVTVIVKDTYNRACAQVLDEPWRRFYENSNTENFDIAVQNRQLLELLRKGQMEISINTVSSDRWDFTFHLFLIFSDGSTAQLSQTTGLSDSFHLQYFPLGNAMASLPVSPSVPANTQDNWAWCSKCQGLHFAGSQPGRCPAGGYHVFYGSGNYCLAFNDNRPPGQPNWRWCAKCQGLHFGGNKPGPCPAGTTHIVDGSGDYKLARNNSSAPGQNDWRWCGKCQGLHFIGGELGICPAGGHHVADGSGRYTLLD